jgi:hypothetical protein
VKRGANGSSPSAVVLKNSVGKDSNISSGFQAHGIYNRIDIVARKIRYTLDEVEQYDKWLCRVHKYSATAGINRPCTEKFAVVLRDMRRGTDDSHPSSLSFISQVVQKTFFNGRLCFPVVAPLDHAQKRGQILHHVPNQRHPKFHQTPSITHTSRRITLFRDFTARYQTKSREIESLCHLLTQESHSPHICTQVLAAFLIISSSRCGALLRPPHRNH